MKGPIEMKESVEMKKESIGIYWDLYWEENLKRFLKRIFLSIPFGQKFLDKSH